MTTLAQIRHVATKDLRENLWVLVLYFAVVAFATASAAQLGGFALWFDSGFLPLIVLFGMFLVAFAVQSDSPTKTGALWTTRPLRPGAVLGAKFAFAVIALIVLPVIGEAIGLRGYGLHGSTLVRAASSSALFYAELLLASALVAGLTRDLWMYVVVCIVVLIAAEIAFSVLGGLIESILDAFPNAIYWGMFAAATAICVAALALLYWRRDPKLGARVFGFIGIAAWIASMSVPAPHRMQAPTGAIVAVRAERADSIPIAAGSPVDVRLDLDSVTRSSADRLVLDRPTAHISLANGSSVDIHTTGQFVLRDMSSTMDGIHWFEFPAPDPVIPIGTYADARERVALTSSNITGITLLGDVTAFTGRIVATVPARQGVSLHAAGRKYTIDSYQQYAGRATLDVSARWIDTTGNAGPSFTRFGLREMSPTIALIRERDGSREGIAPTPNSDGSSSSALVLPGPSVRMEQLRFQLAAPRGPTPDARWFDDPRLGVIEWTPTRRFAIRAEVQDVRATVNARRPAPTAHLRAIVDDGTSPIRMIR